MAWYAQPISNKQSYHAQVPLISVQIWSMEKVQLCILCGNSSCCFVCFFATVEKQPKVFLFPSLLLIFHCEGWMFHLREGCCQLPKSSLCLKTHSYSISNATVPSNLNTARIPPLSEFSATSHS